MIERLLKGPCHDDIDVLGQGFRSIMWSYSLGPIYIAGGGGGDPSTKKILERGTSSAICVLYSVYMQWVVLVPSALSSWYTT